LGYVKVGQENSSSIAIHYRDHGRGKPVVLIHGFPLSGSFWEKQVPVLLEAGRRVITYDRRGFGESSQPATGYDYDTFAADLDKLMTALDLEDATLVGHSMGTGEVARYLGKYGAGRVSRAVLVSPLLPYLLKAPDNPGGVEGRVFEEIKAGIVADRPVAIRRFLEAFYNFDVLKDKRVSEAVLQLSWNVGVQASAKGTLDCVGAWTTDFRRDLQSFRVPTLIVQGDADRILPIASTGIPLQKLLKGSRLAVIEGAPHGLLWTHSGRVNREILDFLGEAKAAAAA
jgi:pimeloyl-ACP methyl ester carboxylesterase